MQPTSVYASGPWYFLTGVNNSYNNFLWKISYGIVKEAGVSWESQVYSCQVSLIATLVYDREIEILYCQFLGIVGDKLLGQINFSDHKETEKNIIK